jgi:hypothetical protein
MSNRTMRELLDEFSNQMTEDFVYVETHGGAYPTRRSSATVSSVSGVSNHINSFLGSQPELEIFRNNDLYGIYFDNDHDKSFEIVMRVSLQPNHPMRQYMKRGGIVFTVPLARIKKKRATYDLKDRPQDAGPAFGRTSSMLNHHLEFSFEQSEELLSATIPVMAARMNERFYKERESIVRAIALLDSLQENNSPAENAIFAEAVRNLTNEFTAPMFGEAKDILDAEWRYRFLSDWVTSCPYACNFWNP